MNVGVTGQTNDFTRVLTGLASVDALLANHKGELGWPGETSTELYGPPSIGKSTIAVYLAAVLTARTGGKRIPIVDFESAYDPDYMSDNAARAGFTGTLDMVAIPKEKSAHEKAMDAVLASLWDDEVSAIIIDSVGMVIPQAEMDNPLGAANMGHRGKLMAQVARKITYRLRNAGRPKFVFLVNHQYTALGTIGYRYTPGGVAKDYLGANRISLSRTKEAPDDTGDILVALKCDKKRFGGVQRNERGYIYLIPDYGVSPEMSNVFDCLYAGIAEKNKSGFVRLDGENYGRVRELRNRVVDGDTSWAGPFQLALAEHGFNDHGVEGSDGDEEGE